MNILAQNRLPQQPTHAVLASALPIGLGFFSIVCQTLLFREFLGVFEGNELGVGSFFGAWLLWVGIGACAAGVLLRGRARDLVTRHIIPLTLAYLPVFLVQSHLIQHARSLAGVEAFELFPLARMTGMALLVNAPFSFVTGFLFTAACVWASDMFLLPVARIYIVETLGAFAGGAAVTLVLGKGASGETTFLGAAGLLALLSGTAAIPSQGYLRWNRFLLYAAIGAILLATAALGGGAQWAAHNQREAWARLLPREQFRGHFTTPQATYLFGESREQFLVMSWGGVCEALPGVEHASEVVAVHMAQHPDARRILVLGPGALPVCLRFLDLPAVESVTWLHPDPDYARRLLRIVPAPFAQKASQIQVPSEEPRIYLRRSQNAGPAFDLALLCLPDVTSLVLNRYVTREFFLLLKTRLTENGVLSVRVSGPANYMSGELVYLGASVLHTLENVFAQVVLKPGDESWLLASDTSLLSESPAELRDRFAGIPAGDSLFPPEGVFALYNPERIAFQREAYRLAQKTYGDAILLNTDAHPKALLYSLSLAVRQAAGFSLAGGLPVLLWTGLRICASAALLYGLLRFAYARRMYRTCSNRTRVFDVEMLILAAGVAGMSLNVAVMFAYQSQFGSLFLDIGLITSLYMLGAFVGGALSERAAVRADIRLDRFLLACLAGHALPVALVALPPPYTGRTVWACLFVLAGFFGGVYFPLAACLLKRAGKGVAETGARLEMFDHAGGALGAVATGLVLLPMFGIHYSVWLIYLFISVFGLLALHSFRGSEFVEVLDCYDRFARRAGYIFAGLAALALVISNTAAGHLVADEEERLAHIAREMTGRNDLEKRTATLADGSRLAYFAVGDKEGFVLPTGPLVEGVGGYGGPIQLAIFVDAEGTLQRVQILSSNETPAYLEVVRPWMDALKGTSLFSDKGLDGVDAVSGATLTSAAVIDTLDRAGRRFAAEVLDLDVLRAAPFVRARPFEWAMIWLAGLTLGAMAIRYRPAARVRRVYLALAVLIMGYWFNLQYSMQHVMSLLGLNLPEAGFNVPFLLVVGVPLAGLLVGNMYCGYLCPFGALQELIGGLRPARMRTDPDGRIWRYGRAVKYVVLFFLAGVYAATRHFSVLIPDPLTTVFSAVRGPFVVLLAVVLLVLSFWFRRFWCRNLCPAGAFLALAGSVRLLRRLLPAAQPARCDLGVRSGRELDCIQCDRCRACVASSVPRVETDRPAASAAPFLASVMVVAAVLAISVAAEVNRVIHVRAAVSVAPTSAAGGTPRDVDTDRIQRMIRRGVLSDHEALYFRRVGESPPEPSQDAAAELHPGEQDAVQSRPPISGTDQ